MRYWVSLILLVLFVIPSSAAMIDVGSVLWPRTYNTRTDPSTSPTLTADTHRVAIVFSVPQSGTVIGVGWATYVVSTAVSVDIRLETVDPATGFPSGTLKAANTFATRAVPAPYTYYEETFLASASVTKGDVLAIVVQYTSVGTGSVRVQAMDAIANSLGLPYGANDTTGTGYVKSDTRAMNIVLMYSDGSRQTVDILPPVSGTTTTATYNSASAADEYALKFTPPVTMRIEGWWGWLYSAAGGAFDVVLYASDGSTVLASSSYDGDNFGSTVGYRYVFGHFATLTLQANTTYYLSVKPTTTTNVNLGVFTFGSVDVLNAMSGNGAHLATRVDGGTWTATTTKRPWIGLKVSGVDSGGGGSYVIGG